MLLVEIFVLATHPDDVSRLLQIPNKHILKTSTTLWRTQALHVTPVTPSEVTVTTSADLQMLA